MRNTYGSESGAGRRPRSAVPRLSPLRTLRAEWFEDALFVPGHACLYSLSGRRIDATMHVREGQPLRRVTPRIDPPKDPAVLEQPVVYGGHLPKHFGHFLLESLSRLWAYTTLGLGPIPFAHSRTVFHLHERELLEAALRPHGAPLLALTEPTRLTSVLVPDLGIILGEDYHPDMCHVYDSIRDSIAGPVGTPDTTPIYFSRTRLPENRRATLNEPELEARLEARGIRIVHPQELPLDEQIRIVAHAGDVIGLEGTALHLTLFRSLEPARTLCLGTRLPEINQARVDRMRSAEHRHIHAEFPLHPRMPGLFGGRELRVGRYRSFLIPRLAERAILRELAR